MDQPRPQRVYVLLSIGLLVFLFAVNIYRARTQSITIDEAFATSLGQESLFFF
jgi:hypothetical protein